MLANHIEKMAPIPVKINSPTVDMNKTLQASPSAKKIGSVSKERDNMQITATTGWYGRKKGGLGTDLKPTDFEDLHNTSREKLFKKTQAMTNT